MRPNPMFTGLTRSPATTTATKRYYHRNAKLDVVKCTQIFIRSCFAFEASKSLVCPRLGFVPTTSAYSRFDVSPSCNSKMSTLRFSLDYYWNMTSRSLVVALDWPHTSGSGRRTKVRAGRRPRGRPRAQAQFRPRPCPTPALTSIMWWFPCIAVWSQSGEWPRMWWSVLCLNILSSTWDSVHKLGRYLALDFVQHHSTLIRSHLHTVELLKPVEPEWINQP